MSEPVVTALGIGLMIGRHENAGSNYSAYVPDLPGCVGTGATVEEAERSIREAIAFHLEGMREDGTPIPPPSSRVDYVEVAA